MCLCPNERAAVFGFSVTKFPSMFHTKIIFSFFSDLAICNHVTDVTEFISSSWEYGMSEIQNPYDICISDIVLWGPGPFEWLQKLHRYTNQIVTSIFQTGFFIFFISLGTCPRSCSSARNVDCAAPFPLLCRGGDFKLGFKNSYPDQNDAQGRYESIRSIPVCSRLH